MVATSQLRRAVRAFTLIELLTVIAIILVVAALAVPNFVGIMKDQKWITATSSIQTMLWRARALASNLRRETAVEFASNYRADNTTMLIETKSAFYEQLPDLPALKANGGNTDWIANGEWFWATGSGTNADLSPGFSSQHPATVGELNLTVQYYGHNAPQSEYYVLPGSGRVYDRLRSLVTLGSGMTIDATRCVNFMNWDAGALYGSDSTNDIRIGTNGALVQPLEPVLCITMVGGTDFKKVQVVKCTGRLLTVR